MRPCFRFIGSALPIFLFAALTVADARANFLAFAAPAGTTSTGAINPVNLGMVFNISSSLTIDELGIYDGNFLTTSEVVTIYNSSGTALASATVLLTDSATGGYLMHSITPMVLTAGQYTVSAFTGNNSWLSTATAPTTGTGITFDNADYQYGSSPAFPTNTFLAATSYYGPNFDVVSASSSTPEPGTWIMIAAGLGWLMLSRAARAFAPAR
jgi:hypothetical protein